MAYYRRRRRVYGRSRFAYSGRRRRRMSFRRGGYRPRSYRIRGRGRYRARARRMSQTVRLVIQTPSDMLPPRPVSGQFARIRRRARF